MRFKNIPKVKCGGKSPFGRRPEEYTFKVGDVVRQSHTYERGLENRITVLRITEVSEDAKEFKAKIIYTNVTGKDKTKFENHWTSAAFYSKYFSISKYEI